MTSTYSCEADSYKLPLQYCKDELGKLNITYDGEARMHHIEKPCSEFIKECPNFFVYNANKISGRTGFHQKVDTETCAQTCSGDKDCVFATYYVDDARTTGKGHCTHHQNEWDRNLPGGIWGIKLESDSYKEYNDSRFLMNFHDEILAQPGSNKDTCKDLCTFNDDCLIYYYEGPTETCYHYKGVPTRGQLLLIPR